MEPRLTELEIRYVYLDETTRALDDVVTELRGQVARLEREMRRLREQLLTFQEGFGGQSSPNEPPPHY